MPKSMGRSFPNNGCTSLHSQPGVTACTLASSRQLKVKPRSVHLQKALQAPDTGGALRPDAQRPQVSWLFSASGVAPCALLLLPRRPGPWLRFWVLSLHLLQELASHASRPFLFSCSDLRRQGVKLVSTDCKQ